MISVRFSKKFPVFIEKNLQIIFPLPYLCSIKSTTLMEYHLHAENGILTPETIIGLRKHALPITAHPIEKLAEAMAFADVAKEMPFPSLIQIVGLRKNISKVAALALMEFYCSPN